MSQFRFEAARRSFTTCALLATALLAGLPAAYGFQVPQEPSRFEGLLIPDPSEQVSPETVTADSLGEASAIGSGWRGFRAVHGEGWEVYLDARSGAPLLVQGQGIPWIAGTGNTLGSAGPVTVETLAGSLRGFVGTNRTVFGADEGELVLNREGSGQVTEDLWQIEFDRAVLGVPVAGDGYVFYIGHGNLMAFGARRWIAVTGSPVPVLKVEEARDRLYAYTGLSPFDPIELVDAGSLMFEPVAAGGGTGSG